MHGFAIIVVPQDVVASGRRDLLQHIDTRVYPYMHHYRRGDERPCPCTRDGKPAEPDCDHCQGTGRTLYNEKGKIDYWMLGGRFDGYIRSGRLDQEKGFGNFFLELARGVAASRGAAWLLSESEQGKLANNVVPVTRIHLRVLYAAWITPEGDWIEDVFDLADDPREYYKDYWAAGLDYHF